MFNKERPKGFDPKYNVSSCFVECNGKFLLLHRQDHKPQGGTWGMPAGKVDEGENRKEAVIREIREETGLVFSQSDLKYFDKAFLEYPNYDYIYHMFKVELKEKKEIELNPEEHQGYKWVYPRESLNMDLIGGLGSCIRFFYRI